jgi:molybdate-binding protein/DNA-binding XRE family transcriptional regulator
MEVKTNLSEMRTKRGLGAAALARRIGVSRQTVYAIEAGDYVPNTIVSLKLAQVLDTTVEEIFELQPEHKQEEQTIEVALMGDAEAMKPGQPVRLCPVDKRVVAVAPEIGGWGLPAADAVLVDQPRLGKRPPLGRVRLLGDKWKTSARILLAGCDPGVSILAQSLAAQGCELVVCYENSSRALELLRDGMVHVAGSHLLDKSTGKIELAPLTKMFPRGTVAVFSYAMWEEGLVTAPGNPKHIAGISDLTRKGVRFTNREQGAGCRRLLDSSLQKARIAPEQIRGYDRITVGHLAAARLVRDGEVDCCISTRVVAQAMSLDFIPLAEKPYHLLVRRTHLNLAPVQTLLETLGRAAFRREVEAHTGYNMRGAGERLA